jgi:hypothetical protein
MPRYAKYHGHWYRRVTSAVLNVSVIEGFRKWWKQWVSQKINAAQDGADVVMAHLKDGSVRLQQLSTDLLLTRGLANTDPLTKTDRRSKNLAWSMLHISELLQEAENALYEGRAYVRDTKTHFTSRAEAGGVDSRYEREEKYWTSKPENKGKTIDQIMSEWFQIRAEEAVEKADRIVSRQLFRHLKALLDKHGWDEGTGQKIDLQEYESEYQIGRVKVVSYVAKEAVEVSRNLTSKHDTVYQRVYLEMLDRAMNLLRRKGLAALWYGVINIKPKDWATVVPYKNHENEKAAANYDVNKDEINLFLLHDTGVMLGWVMHEMGHRYYYKFMSQSDRANFDQWFEQVPAVSEYGKTVTAEDFAEVFEHYCMGRDLTNDQMERFRQFLGRKRSAAVLLVKPL